MLVMYWFDQLNLVLKLFFRSIQIGVVESMLVANQVRNFDCI